MDDDELAFKEKQKAGQSSVDDLLPNPTLTFSDAKAQKDMAEKAKGGTFGAGLKKSGGKK